MFTRTTDPEASVMKMGDGGFRHPPPLLNEASGAFFTLQADLIGISSF